ncbi:MAG: ribose 5-phosphate isomerase B [Clostridia bacterium]|nr:ribose 5-phosphate isomerase B [Clostridia bacterium]
MIAIGADHGGFELKEKIKNELKNKYDFKDYGTFSTDSVDYPKIAYNVAKDVAEKKVDCGILICRTGVGMSIVANKVRGIRCALCYNEKVGKLCKEHNNANMISLPADMLTLDEAVNIIHNWMEAQFAGGRHEKRVNMIEEIMK